MKKPFSLTRRNLFKVVGGGVVVLVAAGATKYLTRKPWPTYPEDFNAYLHVGEDGHVTVYSGKIEMGQGVLTSQAQMAAEELGVELAAITMVLGDTQRCPWDMGTYGSLTTRMFGPVLRAAVAEARLTLLTLASRKLGVPVAQLQVQRGIVSSVAAPGKTVSYGELANGKRIARIVDKKAVLRAAADFSIMGRSAPRLDGRDKVTGAAKYAADIKLPGMLYASILRPPAHGAKLTRVDTTAAAALPGVTVVDRDGLIAALHAHPEAAARAGAKIEAQWQSPQLDLNQDTIFDHLLHFDDEKVVARRGDVSAAQARAKKSFETIFRKGYVAHTPIEPHAALAEIRDGKVTVWVATQTPFPLRDQIAAQFGFDKDDVRVITPFVGGGFGGKSTNHEALEAVRLARATGKPVQVAWNREEEFFYDTFDPASLVKIASGVNADGKIGFWRSNVYAAGGRSAEPPYDIPNLHVKLIGRTSFENEHDKAGGHPFAIGPWRAPGANMNVFTIESQIDLMAVSLQMDPLEFRLRNLTDARVRRVLQKAADSFGWGRPKMREGQGFGIACSVDAGSCVATCADVDVDRESGKITVNRIVCVQDMGIVVNPQGAKMQMQGGLTMGLGYTLSEELRFQGGKILDRNFDSYRIPHFSDVPPIETILIENNDLEPQGGGEPAITCTGAVIANAVFDAIGRQVTRLPMSEARVRQVLA